MELLLNKKIVNKFIETKEENILIDNIYNDFFENYSRSIKESEIKEANNYYSLFCEKLDIDKDDKEFALLAKKYHLSNFDKLDESNFTNNPYYKNIHLKGDIKHKNLLLTKSTILPYQAFIYKDIDLINNDYYREINHLGYFVHPFTYLDLIEKEETWMSITPHEIFTMGKSLNEVKGNVLVLGLGLGYYPYMASLKKEVNTVDVIEINKDIINIFKDNLFNQFSEKEKIRIIESDALTYLKTNNLYKYDYIFIDLWHNPIDALPLYIKIYNLLYRYNIKVNYRIENSIISALRRALITLLEENLEGYKDNDYLKSQNDYDLLINKLYFKTKDKKISSEEELYEFLSEENIKKIIRD